VPRRVKHPKIDTRSARSKLVAAKSAYWAPLERGLSLGYRKGKRSGSWVTKFVRDGQRKEKGIGTADDTQDADGGIILNHSQAVDAARRWFISEGRVAMGLSTNIEGYTVQRAVDDYLEWFADHKKSLRDTKFTINAHILPHFKDRKIAALNTGELRKWHSSLANTPPRLRVSKDSKTQSYKKLPDDPDNERRRKASANRILTVFKAILNRAFEDKKVMDDSEWRRVKPFQNVEKARPDYLSPAEWKRLLRACPKDFKLLVNAGLFTGARYGDIIQLRVKDFKKNEEAIEIRSPKSGKGRKTFLTKEGTSFFSQAVRGKKENDLIFTHSDGRIWGRGHQTRPMQDACKKAGLKSFGFHTLRHTYASHAIMNGAPLAVIAKNLGHADERMVIKHYGHLADDYMKEQIQKAAPKISRAAKHG
jgi:integrase